MEPLRDFRWNKDTPKSLVHQSIVSKNSRMIFKSILEAVL